MRVLFGDRWCSGFLDEHKRPSQCRIGVQGWLTLDPITDMYFVGQADLRRLMNYVGEIGIAEVARKIVSRRQERVRNEKYLAVGWGAILEGDDAGRFRVDDHVVFVAPSHPRCIERVVLETVLIRRRSTAFFPKGHTLSWGEAENPALRALAGRVKGWSPFAGASVDRAAVHDLLDWVELIGANLAPENSVSFTPSAVMEQYACRSRKARSGQPTAVVVGLGHYAKTIVLPHISRRLAVEKVYEIDPMQLGPIGRHDWSVDSSEQVRSGETYDAHFICGYHHTHADLAVAALRGAAVAVVEKPIVTTWGQRQALLNTLEQSPGRLFCCFHKRYAKVNDFAREDLRLEGGHPVDYHCVVYEVPLPKYHWYNWPHSRSRIVSNGCHWIDHFLYLNSFASIRSAETWCASNGDIVCVAELETGASFSMVLTEHGSPRIGVQDSIRLAQGRVTVCIENGNYFAEDERRVLRRRATAKMQDYRRMYDDITRRIVSDEPGDSVSSVAQSTLLMLTLEDRLQRSLIEASTLGERRPVQDATHRIY